MSETITDMPISEAMSLADMINDFLSVSGFGRNHAVIAHIRTDPYIGGGVDIAVFEGEIPNPEIQADVYSRLEQYLAKRTGKQVSCRPEFLIAHEGRIPPRGTPLFAQLNPEANKRYSQMVHGL